VCDIIGQERLGFGASPKRRFIGVTTTPNKSIINNHRKEING